MHTSHTPPHPHTDTSAAPSANPLEFTKTPGLYLAHALFPSSAKEKARAEATARFWTDGIGYAHEQGTRPQTLGYGLADSPAGLLAWIYEKLVTWSLDYPWEDDEGEYQ